MRIWYHIIMDPEMENKETLRRILELSQKNNKILNGIQKSMFWGRVFRTIYWIFIVAATVGAYYYIEPYINGIISTYSGIKDNVSGIFQ